MKIVIKHGKREKEFEISAENERLLRKIADEAKMEISDVLRAAITGEQLKIPGGNIGPLREELLKLQREMFQIEGEWSSTKYLAHTIAHELKSVSVNLIGLVNENRTLRRKLGMEEKYRELRELAEKYLFMRMSELQ